MEPADYEGWYHTRRGHWISDREFGLMLQTMDPAVDARLLDVGCGTGHFSRRFAAFGLQVAGLDSDIDRLEYARCQDQSVDYIAGDALQLPFADQSFDYASAITSLCFVDQPIGALSEMWRVVSSGVALGLLNRNSLLYLHKHGRGGYRGARWDTIPSVRQWWRQLNPAPRVIVRSAVVLDRGDVIARLTEHLVPRALPIGGFIAIALHK
jgi:SAM-dependent methyltransferase